MMAGCFLEITHSNIVLKDFSLIVIVFEGDELQFLRFQIDYGFNTGASQGLYRIILIRKANQ